ncbi:MAG: DUF2339 domain-containing protein [Bryobacteraceae bacterium]|nr:DUF2339 domain-containing protein [Bryobacteraceae bacterium]MDW8377791.1 DUF2339 domain-containing protein [Bryobacterales bacterium]
MDILVFLLALFVWWLGSRRLRSLERELTKTRAQLQASDELLQGLVQRIYALEIRVAASGEASRAKGEASVAREFAPPSHLQDAPPASPSQAVQPGEAPRADEPVGLAQEPFLPDFPAAGELPSPMLAQASQPEARNAPATSGGPSGIQAEASRAQPSARGDWETLIGANLLNAVGVLVLVVGLSLLLGYTLTVMGPLGKVALGIAVGVVMIAAGSWVERLERFVLLGRGLIAGGWAALYFTTYAMSSLPAARVIESRVLGGVLLLAVALGLIAHSLRYRSQWLTLLAFAAAFLALLLSPTTLLSVFASVPLTLALLVISRELGWKTAPLGGMLLVYLSFAFCYDARLLGVQPGTAALYTYWVCFEVYDLLGIRSGAKRVYLDGLISPLNMLLLVGAALLSLPTSTPQAASNFFFSLGGLMLISTILRVAGRKAAAAVETTEQKMLSWDYRIAAALAAALFAGAVLRRFEGHRAEIGLMLEAQLFVLAGLAFKDHFFASLGHLTLALAIAHVSRVDPAAGGRTWGLMVCCQAAQAYLHRWLTKKDAVLSYAGTVLLAIGLGKLVAEPWVGLAWMLAASGLAEILRRFRLAELRYQVLGLGLLALVNTYFTAGLPVETRNAVTAAQFLSAALSYFVVFRLQDVEAELATAASWAGSWMATYAIWNSLPGLWAPLGWALWSTVLRELGLSQRQRHWCWQAHLLFCVASLAAFVNHLFPSASAPRWSQALALGPLVLLAALGWWRTVETLAKPLYAWAGTVLLLLLVAKQWDFASTLIAWAAFMTAGCAAERRFSFPEFRGQTQFVALVTYLGTVAFVLDPGAETVVRRLTAAGLVIAAYHLAQALSPTGSRQRKAFALAGVTLLALLLSQESSSQLLTMSWGLQAVLTLAAGFAAQERLLRLAGLALLLVCILKLFFYDLQELNTVGRILSFIVLGLVLIGASWLYMRFKREIQKYF